MQLKTAYLNNEYTKEKNKWSEYFHILWNASIQKMFLNYLQNCFIVETFQWSTKQKINKIKIK